VGSIPTTSTNINTAQWAVFLLAGSVGEEKPRSGFTKRGAARFVFG